VVPDTTGWDAERAALIDRSLSFAAFLAAHGLVLRSDLLKAWAHWITPEVETRRFDTRFFVAALPPGQRTRDVGGEASLVTWMTPRAALDAAEVFLMPPTYVTLTEIAAFASIDAVFASDREIVTRLPRVVEGELRL
jgi:hypothetical protein